jgi:hypothetical protein
MTLYFSRNILVYIYIYIFKKLSHWFSKGSNIYTWTTSQLLTDEKMVYHNIFFYA